MKSDALRNIRTMRQVKSSLSIARNDKLRTINSLSKTKEEIDYLRSLTDPHLEQVLEKERRRFSTQQLAIKKSQQRLLSTREKLAMIINRNRALTELRRQLQQTQWESKDPLPLRQKIEKSNSEAEPDLHQIELKY